MTEKVGVIMPRKYRKYNTHVVNKTELYPLWVDYTALLSGDLVQRMCQKPFMETILSSLLWTKLYTINQMCRQLVANLKSFIIVKFVILLQCVLACMLQLFLSIFEL